MSSERYHANAIRSRLHSSMNDSLLIRKTSSLENNVRQIEFTVEVAGEAVPCVLWQPRTPREPRTLIALGHGGSQHKKTRDIRDRAIRYATRFGWTSLAIDAPKHGERIAREEAEAERLNTERRLRGDVRAPSLRSAEKIAFLDALAAQAVPEWQGGPGTTPAGFSPAPPPPRRDPRIPGRRGPTHGCQGCKNGASNRARRLPPVRRRDSTPSPPARGRWGRFGSGR